MTNGLETRRPAPGNFLKYIFIHLLNVYYQVNYDDIKVKDGGIEGRSVWEYLVSFIIIISLITKFHLQVNYDDYVYGHYEHRKPQRLSKFCIYIIILYVY